MHSKNKLPLLLSEEDFSFVCPIKTEEMTVVEGGYHCEGCEKKVHDVSNMTQEEYKTLIDKTDNVCVSFKKVATVSLVLSLAACTTAPKPKAPVIMGKIASPTCMVDNKTKTSKMIKIKQQLNSEVGGTPMPIQPPLKEEYKEKKGY